MYQNQCTRWLGHRDTRREEYKGVEHYSISLDDSSNVDGPKDGNLQSSLLLDIYINELT